MRWTAWRSPQEAEVTGPGKLGMALPPPLAKLPDEPPLDEPLPDEPLPDEPLPDEPLPDEP
ncbi:hypothetical protein, partial [Alicyclobacillus sendaiensis]|uniref:hypothetical protein n=1 Tax=Alicyclobacillus sendaiensis TaxID=192387 RepID=UPI0026F40BDE